MVKPVPDGYDTVTPTLAVRGGAQAIEFYKKALAPTSLGGASGSLFLEDLTPEEIGTRQQQFMASMGGKK